jgi:hypothetical protein
MNSDVSIVSAEIDPQRHVRLSSRVCFIVEIILSWPVILTTHTVLTQSEDNHVK